MSRFKNASRCCTKPLKKTTNQYQKDKKKRERGRRIVEWWTNVAEWLFDPGYMMYGLHGLKNDIFHMCSPLPKGILQAPREFRPSHPFGRSPEFLIWQAPERQSLAIPSPMVMIWVDLSSISRQAKDVFNKKMVKHNKYIHLSPSSNIFCVYIHIYIYTCMER